MPIATNPYRIDAPLESTDLLVGREKALAWIASSLAAGEHLLAIWGFPRIGKTSLLNHLPPHLGPGYIYARSWIASPEKWKPEAWQAQLRADIQQALRQAGRSWESPRAKSAGQDADLWRGLDEALGGTPLIIMVDGASLYVKDPQRWDALASFCRELSKSHDLRVIISVQGTAQQAAQTTLGRIPAMSLGLLDEIDSETVLIKTARGELVYDYDAVKELHLWTGGHPFLLQLFGYVLFDEQGKGGRVDIHSVNRGVDQICGAADNLFRSLWSTLSPAARVAMSALGQAHGRHDLYTRRDIHDFLRWSRVRIPAAHVDAAVDELETKGILIKMGASSYRLPLAILIKWVHDHKPVGAALSEARRYHQGAQPKSTDNGKEPIRWTAVASWAMSIFLIAFIIYLWNNRDSGPVESGSLSTLPTSVPTAAPQQTATAPPTHRLAFARKENADARSSIFAALEDGSGLAQLTDDQADDEYPTWSPDGKRLLFASNISGNWDIWSMDANGDHQKNLTASPGDDWMPAWSPDGDAIAFASSRNGNWDIYTARADGSRLTRLTDAEAADLAPTWSPDGERLAFASQRDGNWEIYIMNRDGTGLQRLTENEVTDYDPAWSPVANEIAFETYRDGNMEIYVSNLDSGEITNLSNEPAANDQGPAWSADGKRLAFYSNQDGGWDIMVINRDGSGKANVTQSEALEQWPTWQP